MKKISALLLLALVSTTAYADWLYYLTGADDENLHGARILTRFLLPGLLPSHAGKVKTIHRHIGRIRLGREREQLPAVPGCRAGR